MRSFTCFLLVTALLFVSIQPGTSSKKVSGSSGEGRGDGSGGGLFGPGGFNIPGVGDIPWMGSIPGTGKGGAGIVGGGYGAGYGGPSGGYSRSGTYRPVVVCKDKGPCFGKKLRCPAKCFTSYSGSGKNYGGGGGGGGCTMDCSKKCVAYC